MQHGYLKLPSIRSNTDQQKTEHNSASNVLLDAIYSIYEESDTEVEVVITKDTGSHFSSVTVEIQAVLANGTIDTGVDIIKTGGNLLYKVVTVAILRKQDLRAVDERPQNYDQTLFRLN